ncbi:hypothetical protein [Cohnella rhizosphaerae]|uniref:hypothetical protein n=1 Tax=Cohnella rhizosphaerae TaxID=1457232 RepID=UPI002405558E|nr:hypothetical protein [Cohnella rhizosphaerae]
MNDDHRDHRAGRENGKKREAFGFDEYRMGSGGNAAHEQSGIEQYAQIKIMRGGLVREEMKREKLGQEMCADDRPVGPDESARVLVLAPPFDGRE